MSARFDVAVRDTVTYYWRLVYNRDSWVVVGLVSESAAVNGGPTYGISLDSQSTLYQPDGNTTDVGVETRPRVNATYYNTNGAGCPGVAFMRTRFTAGNGLNSYYEITANDEVILQGFLRRGAQSDDPGTSLPPGGDPDACIADEDGIVGGNTT